MSWDSDREKGPVEILCKEISYRFDRRMEGPQILIAFTRVLVGQVALLREMQMRIATAIGSENAPSGDSMHVLERVTEMLQLSAPSAIIAKAAEVHDFIDEIAPEGKYPTDHLIDMLSSCVSAVRFGLQLPCHSRHAAEAASHIWKHIYGISLFDSFTPNWEHDWARAQLADAIFSLIRSPATDKG